MRGFHAYIPDGYFPDGKPRPKIKVFVLYQTGNYYYVRYPDGRQEAVAHHAVTFSNKEE